MDTTRPPGGTWAAETVADALPDMLARFGPDLRLTYANPALRLATGLGLDEMLGRPLGSAGDGTPFAPQLIEALQASIRSGSDEYRELYTDLPDGTRRWLELRVIPEHDPDGRITSLISICRDTTARHREEEAAQAVAVQVRMIEQHLPGFLFRASGPLGSAEDLRVEYVSSGFERVLGYAPDEVEALTSVFRLLHPDVAGTRDRILDHLSAPGPEDVDAEHIADVRLVAKDGSSVWMRGPISMAVEGDRVAVSGLLFDVTERRDTEEALANVEKLEGLRVLAAGVAHDFANLLAVVLGNMEIALAELPPDASVADNLHRAVGAAWHASDLTRQLMAYAGRAALQIEALDLPTLIEGMRDLLVSTAGHIPVDFELDGDMPLVDGDRTQLAQVVLNLVKNAAEAMPERPGSITIGCFTRTYSRAELDLMVLGEARPPGRYAVLEVRDTGMGMDEETARRVFDPFFSTKRDGRGLGLASVLGIVRGHHGAVTVRSIPGGGTRIAVAIPASAQVATARQQATG